MRKYFYYSLSMLLVLSSVLLLWRFHSDKIRNQNITNQLQYKYEQISEESEKIKQYFVYQDLILPKNLADSLISQVSHDSNTNGDLYLFACFSKQNCGICMKRLIVDLDDFKRNSGFTQIYLFGDIPENEFFSMLEISNHDYDYIYKPDLPENEWNYFSDPLLFVINSNGIIQHLFVPELMKEFNEIYFENVLSDLLLNNTHL